MLKDVSDVLYFVVQLSLCTTKAIKQRVKIECVRIYYTKKISKTKY